MKRAGLEVGEEGLAELASWLRVKRLAQALGMRACVVLLSGQGLSLREVARRLWGKRAHGMPVAPSLLEGAVGWAEKPAAQRTAAPGEPA